MTTVSGESYGAIDIVCNAFTPEVIDNGWMSTDRNFRQKTRMTEAHMDGVPMATYLDMMDQAGIERSFLIASRSGDLRVKGSSHMPTDYIAGLVRDAPTRFSGLIGIDPSQIMNSLEEVDHAIRDLGFVGAHLYPHWFDQPPDAACYYPFYAKCCELGVPVMMQVGQCLLYNRHQRHPSVGRPICLDRIAIDFPDLVLIGIHIGYPWHDEMISMAWKHPNVHIGLDAYAPRHWPATIRHYMNTFGQDKVLFGTDWPVVDPVRAMSEIAEMDLRPEAKRKILFDNALKLFNL